MKINYNKNFLKQFDKKETKIKERFLERQDLFIKNKFDTKLNNHKLRGEYEGYRSINITGDIRAVYEEIEEDYIEFIAIGAHSELFE